MSYAGPEVIYVDYQHHPRGFHGYQRLFYGFCQRDLSRRGHLSFLQRCTQEDERKRPTPEEIVEGVRALLGQWDGSNEAQRPDNPQTLGQGQYRVVRQLGSGATAFTYLVEDTFIGGMYVLKRIRNQALAQRLAGAEFRALRDLN